MNLHCKKPQNQTHLSGWTWEKKMKLNILSFKTASQAIIWPLKVSKKESPTVTRRFFVEKKDPPIGYFWGWDWLWFDYRFTTCVRKARAAAKEKNISWKRWPRIAAQCAATGIDAMIRRRPQSYEFHVSGSQPISALRVRSYDNPDMREGAPYTSYENMNGRALLEESSAAMLRYKGGINIIFSYLGDLRWLSRNSQTISYIYFSLILVI